MGPWNYAIDAALLGVLSMGAVTDVRHGKVYNRLTYPAALGGVALSVVVPAPAGIGLAASLLGILVAGAPLFVAYLAGGIGAGDVKLMAAVGAFLGPLPGLYVLLYSSLVGGVMAVFLLVWREGFPGLWTVFRRGRSEQDLDGDASPGQDRHDAPLPRLPFAVAVLVGAGWVMVERWMGVTLFDVLMGAEGRAA